MIIMIIIAVLSSGSDVVGVSDKQDSEMLDPSKHRVSASLAFTANHACPCNLAGKVSARQLTMTLIKCGGHAVPTLRFLLLNSTLTHRDDVEAIAKGRQKRMSTTVTRPELRPFPPLPCFP